jgi:hypothetical protein
MRKPRTHDRAHERHLSMSRRCFLRGLGVSLALPAFESLLPAQTVTAVAQGTRALATTATGAPLRLAVLYYANGHLARYFWPAVTGAELHYNRTLQPIKRFKNQVQIVGGLNHAGGDPGPDGGGDHARGSGGFLSGVRIRKTGGADFRAGTTIDQILARQVGHLTRFPSLELTCDIQQRTGSCDTGYSCVYQNNLSWTSPTTPVAPERNPRHVFERLFGVGQHGERAQNYLLRLSEQSSLLDYVLEEARDMQRQLAVRDRQRLDEYLTSLREIERRIQRTQEYRTIPDPDVATPPEGIPQRVTDHIQIMMSVLALAFQTDSSRLCTFILSNDGCNNPIPELGFAEGHHISTHHNNNASLIEKTAQFETFYMTQFAFLVDKLSQMQDLDGNSVLHNSMIVYTGGIADGNRHTHSNLPTVLAGAGGGTLTSGRYRQLPSQPISNFFLSVADRMGLRDTPRLGDSTGRAEGL